MIDWQKRASTVQHELLGRKRVIYSKCGRFRIEWFLDTPPPLRIYPQVRRTREDGGEWWDNIRICQMVETAKDACERFLKVEANIKQWSGDRQPVKGVPGQVGTRKRKALAVGRSSQ